MLFRKTVTCEKCGVVLLKEKAKEIITCGFCGDGDTFRLKKYYCLEHRPPYNEQDYSGRYYARLEVEKDGEPIGYMKLKGTA